MYDPMVRSGPVFFRTAVYGCEVRSVSRMQRSRLGVWDSQAVRGISERAWMRVFPERGDDEDV